MIRYTFYAFIIVICLSPLHIHADISFTKQNVPTVTPNTNHLNSTPQHEDISRKAAKAMAEAESAVRESETVIRETKLAEEAASTATTQQETARNALLKTESAIQLGHILDAKAEAHKAVEAANAAKTAASMAEESVSNVKTAVENVQRHQKAAEQAAKEAREAIKKVKEAEKQEKEETRKKATKEQVTPTQPDEQKGVTPIEKTVENVPLDPKKKVEENAEVESPAELQEKGKDGDNVEKDASSETMTPVVQVVPPETVENTTSEEGVGTPHTTDSDRNTKTPPVDPSVKNLENKTQQPIEADKVNAQNNASEAKDTERVAPSQPEKGNSEEPIQQPVNVPIVTETGKNSSASGNTGIVLPEKKDNENEQNVNPLPEQQQTEEPKEEKPVTPDVPSTRGEKIGEIQRKTVPQRIEETPKPDGEVDEDGNEEGEQISDISNPDLSQISKKNVDDEDSQAVVGKTQNGVISGDVHAKHDVKNTNTLNIGGNEKMITERQLTPSTPVNHQVNHAETKGDEKEKQKKTSDPKKGKKDEVTAAKQEDQKKHPDSTGTDLFSEETQKSPSEHQLTDDTVVNAGNTEMNSETEAKPGTSDHQDSLLKFGDQSGEVSGDKSSESKDERKDQQQKTLSGGAPTLNVDSDKDKVKQNSKDSLTEAAQGDSKNGKDEDQGSQQSGLTTDQTSKIDEKPQGGSTQQPKSGDDEEAKEVQSAQTVESAVTHDTVQTVQTTTANVDISTAKVEKTSKDDILSSASFQEHLTRMKFHASALSTSITAQTELQNTTITLHYEIVEEDLIEAIKKVNEALNSSEKSLQRVLTLLLSATKDAESADTMAKKAAKAIGSVNEKDFAFTHTNTITFILYGVFFLLTMTTA